MKAFLPRFSIVVTAILVLGAGLALAATPSRPGMFLYPVKQLTRSITDYFVETVVIGVPALVRGQPEPGPTATATSLPMITEDAAAETMAAVDAADTVAESLPQPTATADTVRRPDPALLVRPDATRPVVLATDQPSVLHSETDADESALSRQESATFVVRQADQGGGGSDKKRDAGSGGSAHPEGRSDDDEKSSEDD